MKKSLGAKTLVYPTPVWVIGTYDREGKPNVMTAAWTGVCCSQPPMVYVSLQKVRYTYDNIVSRKAFTINVPSEAHVKSTDFFGIASGKNTDKLTAAGLTAEDSELVDAPYIKEFPMVLECVLAHTFELGLHTQFVGEIMDVKADEAVLDEGGNPDFEKVAPITYAPMVRGYYGCGPSLGRAFKIGKEYL